MLTDADLFGVVTTNCPVGGRAVEGTASSPQLTTEFGCTLTGPAGSTPVTVSSSEVQVMPTADASAELAADVGMSGPSSRGNSDTVSPTVITLPSRACRSVADEIDWVARFEPRTVTDRAPYTVTGATSTVVFSRSPALDSVTSSSSAVPAGVSGRGHARHRRGGARTGQRNRIPFPNAKGGNGFRMQPDHAAARVERRGVQPGGEGELVSRRRAVRDVETCHVSGPAVCAARAGPSTTLCTALRARLRPADRPPRLRVAPSACRPTPRGASTASFVVRTANGM